MKFKFLFFVFLVTLKSLSQTIYQFDTFIEYTNNQNDVIRFFLFNSKDDSYYFAGNNLYMEGTITDKKSNTTHRFKIDKQTKDIVFQYIETISKNEKKNSTFPTYQLEKDEKKIGRSTQLTIFAYSISKKKKLRKTIEVIYDESNFKLDESFLSSYAHLSAYNSNFKVTFPCPSKITIKQNNVKDLIFLLLPIKDINTQLYIPN